VAKKGGEANMFKFLKIGLLTIVLALSFSASAVAIEKSKIDSLINYVKDIEAGEYNGFTVYKTIEPFLHQPTDVIWLKVEENTTPHDYFRITWRLHVLKIYDVPETDYHLIRVIFRNYADFITVRSRGFEEWWIMDMEANGIISETEKWQSGKNYVIMACPNGDASEDCSNNWIIKPSWPAGFRNMGWASPSLEELQEQYDKEINYWIQVIWGKEE
jgi:hypothetical protein